MFSHFSGNWWTKAHFCCIQQASRPLTPLITLTKEAHFLAVKRERKKGEGDGVGRDQAVCVWSHTIGCYVKVGQGGRGGEGGSEGGRGVGGVGGGEREPLWTGPGDETQRAELRGGASATLHRPPSLCQLGFSSSLLPLPLFSSSSSSSSLSPSSSWSVSQVLPLSLHTVPSPPACSSLPASSRFYDSAK